MDDRRAFDYVVKEIHKQVQEQVTFLAANRADSIEEYRRICGVIRGLNLAEGIISDLVQRLERE